MTEFQRNTIDLACESLGYPKGHKPSETEFTTILDMARGYHKTDFEKCFNSLGEEEQEDYIFRAAENYVKSKQQVNPNPDQIAYDQWRATQNAPRAIEVWNAALNYARNSDLSKALIQVANAAIEANNDNTSSLQVMNELKLEKAVIKLLKAGFVPDPNS